MLQPIWSAWKVNLKLGDSPRGGVMSSSFVGIETIGAVFSHDGDQRHRALG
jgi:hypothetical protein